MKTLSGLPPGTIDYVSNFKCLYRFSLLILWVSQHFYRPIFRISELINEKKNSKRKSYIFLDLETRKEIPFLALSL